MKQDNNHTSNYKNRCLKIKATTIAIFLAGFCSYPILEAYFANKLGHKLEAGQQTKTASLEPLTLTQIIDEAQ